MMVPSPVAPSLHPHPLTSKPLPLHPPQSHKALKERNRRAALRRYCLSPEDIEAPADGVFRSVAADAAEEEAAPHAVSQVRGRSGVESGCGGH
jgi:hypothetical protein